MICHEGLLELKKHDEENQTQLHGDIESVYWSSISSATQAAKGMFIHRSTFLYRLDRIWKSCSRLDVQEIFYLECHYQFGGAEREKE